MHLFKLGSSIRALLYPDLCLSCNRWLVEGETDLCLACFSDLPRTHWKPDLENPAAKTFWARVPVSFAYSWLHFFHESRTRILLHQMKYRGNQNLAVSLGKLCAADLRGQAVLDGFHALLPVPLHPKKLKSRGYNQSEKFATGIADVLQLPCLNNVLCRQTNSSTQTRKGRADRWENMSGIFSVQSPDQLRGKNVILIDDVITTGATAEACMIELLKAGAGKIAIVSLAFSDR